MGKPPHAIKWRYRPMLNSPPQADRNIRAPFAAAVPVFFFSAFGGMIATNAGGLKVVRYGHMRAVDMGTEVHFKQALAEATGYPDGYFDIVISYILFHEVTKDAAPKIISEVGPRDFGESFEVCDNVGVLGGHIDGFGEV